MVFYKNPGEYYVYTREKHDEKVILIVWVDNLIIAASNHGVLNRVRAMLTKRFQMTDLGKLKHFLGIDFDQTEGKVKMSQNVNKILERFEMQDFAPGPG